MIIISDIHGNINNLIKIEDKLLSTDKILILGDLFSYSHNNDLDIINYLNKFSNKIIAIRGNGDIEYSEANFNYLDPYKIININNLKVLLTHGHLKLDINDYDLLIQGHTHKYLLSSNKLNPGTLGMGNINTYIEYDNNMFYLKDINNNIINQIKI